MFNWSERYHHLNYSYSAEYSEVAIRYSTSSNCVSNYTIACVTSSEVEDDRGRRHVMASHDDVQPV